MAAAPAILVSSGDNGLVSPELGKLAGKAADNVYVSAMWSPNRNDEKTKAFVANDTKKYGHAPDQFAAGAYDGVYIVVDAMKRAGTTTDKAKIRDAMAQMKNFSGGAAHSALMKSVIR